MSIHEWFIRFVPVLPIALLMGTSTVQAQNRFSGPGWVGPGPIRNGNVGPGVGWTYFNTPGGPNTVWAGNSFGLWGFGQFPAAIGGFWTNGLSLYGPPVPTFAPVPGVFGGSDAHRVYFGQTPFPFGAYGWGLGWAGTRSPSPRNHTPTVSVHPPVESVYAGGPPPSSPQCARLSVRVPHPDAELWIDTKTTKQTGSDRSFESPELGEGQTYRYKLVANWKVNGEERAESRNVIVQAGQSFVVDFTRSE